MSNAFFKPLRRKLGVATLVLACVFAAGWLRSLTTTDTIIFRGHRHAFVVASRSQQIELQCVDRGAVVTMSMRPSSFPTFRERELGWTPLANMIEFSYWTILLPLTLLSAWLLLSKPRATMRKPASES